MRVTEILSIIKNPAYENISPEVLHDKARWGTGFHKTCYKWIQTNIGVPKDSEYYEPLEGFKEWYDMAIQEVISAEMQYKNEELQIEGTPDIIAIIKGDKKPSVIDLKTSTGIYYSQAVQLSAYAKLSVSERRLIFQLKDKKTSKYKIHEFPVKELNFDWNMFLSARDWYLKLEAK